jgi:hypothetical protein
MRTNENRGIKQNDTPAPEPDFIQVPTHNCGFSKVQGYKDFTTTPNILAFQKPKMTARGPINWHTLCTSRSYRILSKVVNIILEIIIVVNRNTKHYYPIKI